tara:strand:- start:69 stop:572 length:504 start_codon:yes stop_codon:yes gene_type:complete
MAFKMKAGKEGPMKKNFGSSLKKAIPEGAEGLNKMIQSEKGKEAVKNMGFDTDSKGALLMKKDKAPMMRMDPSAMKAMGKPAPVKAMDKSPMKEMTAGKLIEILPKPPKQPKQRAQKIAGDKPKQYLKSKITKTLVDKSRYTGRTPQSQMTPEELAKKKNIKNPQAT